MSFTDDLPKELQILISGYEPKFIILCGCSDWHFIIRKNFRLEFAASVSPFELQQLYIKKCFKENQYL